ncbi:hypothetical protein S2091_4112 [Solimicrobium silvestre]|uniref:Uncharacterized protein n=1 Tax=Solimicrobium silvestre TaxID=2099400 RepID=A0A2S9GU06_9BURK|nr:hypothetical protein S2091_4112 [Solimicrobium silvestre]
MLAKPLNTLKFLKNSGGYIKPPENKPKKHDLFKIHCHEQHWSPAV